MRFNHAKNYRSLAAIILAAAALALAGSTGCTGTGPTTEPADAALKDPMNYTPDIPNTDMNTGTGNSNAKGLDKDINDLLNP